MQHGPSVIGLSIRVLYCTLEHTYIFQLWKADDKLRIREMFSLFGSEIGASRQQQQ